MNEQSLHEAIALRELITQARKTSTTNTTPSERSRFNNILRKSHQQILDLYGKYIKKPLTDNTVVSKFILLDKDSFDVVVKKNHEIRKINTPENYDLYAEMIPVGRQRIFTLSQPNVGPELTDATCYMIATHEISHLYMDDSLPQWLAETGAYYYGRKSIEALGIKAHSPNWEPYEKIYDSLEKKYGENLHYTYFGTIQTPIFRLLIGLQYSNNESIRKLFPDSGNLRN